MDNVLDSDAVMRHRVITALNKLGAAASRIGGWIAIRSRRC